MKNASWLGLEQIPDLFRCLILIDKSPAMAEFETSESSSIAPDTEELFFLNREVYPLPLAASSFPSLDTE